MTIGFSLGDFSKGHSAPRGGTSFCARKARNTPFHYESDTTTMYLHIGNNQMLPERRIIGVFDLEITSQSRLTAAFLKRAEQDGVVIDACEDIPKSFLVCDHPYHRQIVYLSQLNSRTLLGRAEEQENSK